MLSKTILATLCLASGIMQHASVAASDNKGTANRGLKKAKKRGAARAFTLWWVIFNKPSKCQKGMDSSAEIKCGMPDVMGAMEEGKNPAGVSIHHATGSISDMKGNLRMVATNYASTCDLDVVNDDDGHYLFGGPASIYGINNSTMGYCKNGEPPEVHLVVRDHGPAAKDPIDQLTQFTDSMCKRVGGKNLCQDVGMTAFAASDADFREEKDLMQAVPPGCKKAKTCTKEQAAVQIVSGKATLIQTGDAIQAVLTLVVPMVKLN